MGSSDYRLCDICCRKCFYDSNLNYDFDEHGYNGESQLERRVKDKEYVLDYLGEWKCLCHECSKTHDVVIVKKQEQQDEPK